VTEPSARPTRAQQRRQTEERILAAARQIFAERGYDRTTIRAVAAAAGVDAGLVMHYFGSKSLLFARAVETPAGETSLAVLRSMLTNADAADRYRAAAEPQLRQITEVIPTPDADLRASLLSAIVHGVIAERYLLRLTHLAEASPEEIVDLLRPCFQSLTTPPQA
jgi:AcrR family transcriptional regulator